MRAAAGVKAAIEEGILPLDVILRRMRDPGSVADAQFEAAVAAAPYVHPRLSAATVKHEDPIAGLTFEQLLRLATALGARDQGFGDGGGETPADGTGILH